MKQMRLIAVVLALVVALAACGGNTSQQKSSDMKEEKMMDEGRQEDKEAMKDDQMQKDKEAMKDDQMQEDKEAMKDDQMQEDKETMKDDNMSEDEMGKVEKMNQGELAMDFTLTDKDGQSFTLSQAKGKKLYTKFWASWCSICLAGLEELNSLAGQDNDFEVITIVSPNARGEKSKEDFIKWFDTLGYDNIRVLFDEGGQVADTYGVRAFPTSVLIGSDGVLVGTRPGHMSSDVIIEAFAEIK